MTANSNTKTQHGAGGALGIALAYRELQQIERRKGRESERAQLLLLSSASDNDTTRWCHGELQVDYQARDLALLQAVTARRGFITQQLTAPTLRPLERWNHQLQLLKADEAQRNRADPNSDPIVNDEEENDEDDHATALSALERVLTQDVACVNLRYAAGVSMQDVAKSLLDSEGAFVPQSSLLPEEILSFSTMRSGRVCRVTCVRHANNSSSPIDRQYGFHSSLFIRDFETRATRLMLQASHARSLIEFVWSELSPP